MANTKIEWATQVWNPVTGCSKISEGCANCYAEPFAKRLQNHPNFDIKYKYRDGFKPTTHPEVLNQPYEWKKPQRVFVCQMGDLFHDDVPNDFLIRVWSVMVNNPIHTFLLLTKRPENALKFYNLYTESWRSNNIWIGVTAENQREADKRIPILLQIPAAIRFVSVEPMLSEIDIKPYINALDWVICGGETGRKARPLHPSWVRSLRDRCYVAQVPFFFKQWGEFDYSKGFAERVGKRQSGSMLDGKEWKQFPDNSRQVANKIITEMQSAGLTPDQMLKVIAMARQKYNQLKTTNKTENICQ